MGFERTSNKVDFIHGKGDITHLNSFTVEITEFEKFRVLWQKDKFFLLVGGF